jgi:hypothetical protein
VAPLSDGPADVGLVVAPSDRMKTAPNALEQSRGSIGGDRGIDIGLMSKIGVDIYAVHILNFNLESKPWPRAHTRRRAIWQQILLARLGRRPMTKHIAPQRGTSSRLHADRWHGQTEWPGVAHARPAQVDPSVGNIRAGGPNQR